MTNVDIISSYRIYDLRFYNSSEGHIFTDENEYLGKERSSILSFFRRKKVLPEKVKLAYILNSDFHFNVCLHTLTYSQPGFVNARRRQDHPQLSSKVNEKLRCYINSLEKTNGKIGDCIYHYFFGDCILYSGSLSEKLIHILEEYIPNLPLDPIDAYEIANKPDHLIRNYLIRNTCDLLDEGFQI